MDVEGGGATRVYCEEPRRVSYTRSGSDETMTPKWQKARILSCAIEEWSHGAEIWCKIEPPHIEASPMSPDLDEYDRPGLTYWINLYGLRNAQLVIRAHVVELLARSPDDFAEEVEMINYNEWVA